MRAAVVTDDETADVIAISLTELYSIRRRFCCNLPPPDRKAGGRVQRSEHIMRT